MTDLIERDEALRLIAEEQAKAKYGMEDCALYRASKIVRELPAANSWIPCSERLPHGGRVLATTKQGYVVDVIFVAKGSQWFRNGEYFPTDTVIAWMPMPDAYELPESGAQDEAQP